MCVCVCVCVCVELLVITDRRLGEWAGLSMGPVALTKDSLNAEQCSLAFFSLSPTVHRVLLANVERHKRLQKDQIVKDVHCGNMI